ncbi:hypothetical protein NBRC10513v2_002806 [Rhodotorula toruloides]|nr:hypothetical protein AAT19DRAFT_13954 [Rhodotorula toruloides]
MGDGAGAFAPSCSLPAFPTCRSTLRCTQKPSPASTPAPSSVRGRSTCPPPTAPTDVSSGEGGSTDNVSNESRSATAASRASEVARDTPRVAAVVDEYVEGRGGTGAAVDPARPRGTDRRASPFTHTTWGGSGLGLWIARNLCELQAGRIEVASTVGKGSIFRCFITARAVDNPDAYQDHQASFSEGYGGPVGGLKMTVGQRKGEDAPLKGLTILCCEDNQINRTVLRRQLTKEGCEVLLACDGQEGLDQLQSRADGTIDCVLMDIEMPVMDGLAATRAIRHAESAGQRRGHQPIIGLTGNARSGQRQIALDAGIDVVVTKPYKMPELISQIRSLLSGSSPSASPSRPAVPLLPMHAPAPETTGQHPIPTPSA